MSYQQKILAFTSITFESVTYNNRRSNENYSFCSKITYQQLTIHAAIHRIECKLPPISMHEKGFALSYSILRPRLAVFYI